VWVGESSFWYRPTRVVPDQRPLNGRCRVRKYIKKIRKKKKKIRKYINILTIYINTHTHTHTRLTALFLGLPRWSGTRKVKPIWILLKQGTVLWRCWLGVRKGIRPVETEWWGAGVVICLERGADLHAVQLMPLPLTVSCFKKIQTGFTFLVPAHPGSPG